MKAPSILLFASLLTLCTSQPAPAVMNEFSTTNRLIAVTNVSATSEVRPLAAYILFPTPATGTVSISRVTRGVPVPLARHSFTNTLALTWLPPADFPLRRGESFAVSSTVARFTLQLESRAEGGAVERTEASEWYTDGRPFGAQSAGGSSVVVSNSQQVIVTNNIVVTNSITVNAGAGGPQFGVGLSGEYVATNTTILGVNNENFLISSDGYGGGSEGRTLTLRAGNSQGSGAVGGNVIARLGLGDTSAGLWRFRVTDSSDAALFDVKNDGSVRLHASGIVGTIDENQTLSIRGNTGNGTSQKNVDIGAGLSGDYGGSAGGTLTVHGGDGSSGFNDNGGGALVLRGGSGAGGSGSIGADVLLTSGTGASLDGKVIIEGNSSHGYPGAAGIHLRLANSELYVSTDGGATVTAGVSEDVALSDGLGGTITLHFLKGIYVGHDGP